MTIIPYTSENEKEWDTFVREAKNGHFFFQRGYMEYHADRFEDASLLVRDERQKLLAILPANRRGDILYTHQGLTFGGFLVDDKMKTETMLQLFDALSTYCKAAGIARVVYKCIPHIYHVKPAEEDLYALFRHDAPLIRRDVSSTIDLSEPVRYSKGRKWTINKAKKEGFEIVESTDYTTFWNLLTDVLAANHDAAPVHTEAEMRLLAGRFPGNIRLFMIGKEGTMLAGALMFVNPTLVHTQYLANSEAGRELGALDLLIDHLIREVFARKRYFDFGISNEEAGRCLNTGLIAQKEGFGARPVVHDFYELEMK